MSEKITSQWLNKKQVRERFGDISDTNINDLMETRCFPPPVPLNDKFNKKWYLPSIIKWEREQVNKTIKSLKDK